MGAISLLFSVMFFSAFLTYLYWGIQIIRIDSKQAINKAFLFLSISLCIWSFGYALSNSASNIETALFWRRVGSIGRMYLFSIILHFIILLTHEKDKLYKKWIPILLHIPSMVLVYVFSFSNTLAPVQYNLKQIDYGWLDKPVDNIWNKIYYLYFVIYMLTTLIVVMRWKTKIKDEKITKQANLIFKTMTIGIFFGGFLDILPNLIFTKPVPQLSSIFILLPVGAMYHAAKNYDVFRIEIPKKPEVIVTEEDRENIFKNLSIVFYIAAILAFISEYIPYMNEENSFRIALLKALSLMSIGIIVRIIQNIKKESLKENLTILVLVLSIPLTILQYTKDGSITVWAFPMVLIISSVIFSKLTLLILTTVIVIITQILIWIINPETIVVVDKFDYM